MVNPWIVWEVLAEDGCVPDDGKPWHGKFEAKPGASMLWDGIDESVSIRVFATEAEADAELAEDDDEPCPECGRGGLLHFPDCSEALETPAAELGS